MFYCFLADGFEEIEALATVDILRRADIECKTCSVASPTVTGGHGIGVSCDMTIDELCDFDTIEGVILPGGLPGVPNMEQCDKLIQAVQYAYDNDKYICAICAAPMLLGHMGITEGLRFTCYPSFEEHLKGAHYTANNAEIDGRFITAKGPGCAIDFALAIVSTLKGEDIAQNLRKTMQYDK